MTLNSRVFSFTIYATCEKNRKNEIIEPIFAKTSETFGYSMNTVY